MKRVQVKLFAAYRDAAGLSEVSVDSEAASLRELFDELTGRYPGLAREPHALVAINDELVDWDAPFSEGDQVLFFPPVSGG
jgi:molybdopterin converting factor subunit 1